MYCAFPFVDFSYFFFTFERIEKKVYDDDEKDVFVQLMNLMYTVDLQEVKEKMQTTINKFR